MKLFKTLSISLFLLCTMTYSVQGMETRTAAYTLALMGGFSTLCIDACEKDWQMRKPFRAGFGSPLIAAITMTAIEQVAKTYIHTDIFTKTLIGQSLKIIASVATTAGFCQWLSVYKHMAQDKKRVSAYLKGLLCGGLLILPFCSDL